MKISKCYKSKNINLRLEFKKNDYYCNLLKRLINKTNLPLLTKNDIKEYGLKPMYRNSLLKKRQSKVLASRVKREETIEKNKNITTSLKEVPSKTDSSHSLGEDSSSSKLSIKEVLNDTLFSLVNEAEYFKSDLKELFDLEGRDGEKDNFVLFVVINNGVYIPEDLVGELILIHSTVVEYSSVENQNTLKSFLTHFDRFLEGTYIYNRLTTSGYKFELSEINLNKNSPTKTFKPRLDADETHFRAMFYISNYLTQVSNIVEILNSNLAKCNNYSTISSQSRELVTKARAIRESIAQKYEKLLAHYTVKEVSSKMTTIEDINASSSPVTVT